MRGFEPLAIGLKVRRSILLELHQQNHLYDYYMI